MKSYKLGKHKKLIDISKINYNIISHQELNNKIKTDSYNNNSNQNSNTSNMSNNDSNSNKNTFTLNEEKNLRFSNNNSIMINPSHKRHYYLVDDENKIVPEIGFNTKACSNKDYLNKIYLKQIEQNKIKKIEERIKEKEDESKRLKSLMETQDNFLKKSQEVKNAKTRYFLTDIKNIVETGNNAYSNSLSKNHKNNIIKVNELTISNNDNLNKDAIQSESIIKNNNLNSNHFSYIEEDKKEKEKIKYKKNLYKNVLDSQIVENNYWAKNFINDYGNLATEFEHLKEKKCSEWYKRNFNMNLNIKPCKNFLFKLR